MKIKEVTNKVYFIILFLMVQIIAFGQGRKCKSPRINLQSQLRAESWAKQRSTVAVNKLIRVYFHIVRNTDGSQAAATIEDINNEFQDLIDDFDADNICFANVGFDFINNTAMNQSLDPDDEDDVAMLHPFLVPNCINIFYHQSLGEYGGNAYNIPNTFCSIDDGNIGLWSTISHEVGHCLGLLHTFSTATGEEYISGFNCALHGDRVCDTPADPYTEAACFSANNCNYTGNCEDPTGNTDYVPPYQNIMSYWGLGGCDPNHLTSGQFARVNSFLQTDLNLITTVSPATVGAGLGSFSSGYYFRTAHNSISINPSLNITGSTIASLQSKSVTCPPGFLIAPTSGSITIKATCDY